MDQVFVTVICVSVVLIAFGIRRKRKEKNIHDVND